MNIRREGEYKVELRENMRGGDGTVKITNFVDKEALCEKARLFKPDVYIDDRLTEYLNK